MNIYGMPPIIIELPINKGNILFCSTERGQL